MNPFAALAKEMVERPGHACTESMRFKGGIRRSQAADNVLRLTAAEEKTLSAVVEGGSAKGAAQLLGLSHKTVEAHLWNVRKKMAVKTTIHAILKWDREVQKRAEPVSPSMTGNRRTNQ